MVGQASADPAGRFSQVVGIIDFGDMLHGYTASEAAIGAAYAMMGKNDPLAAAAHLIAGYHDVFPLTELEMKLLYDFIAMRLCLSVAISAEQKNRKKPPLVFDLGVESPELSPLSEPCNMDDLAGLLFEKLRAAGAEIGIGRYDEARSLYTSDIFKTAGNDAPEWRTVHLGIDLHMPPGSPVFAPLRGRVHSFQNNKGPLDYGPTIILEHETSEGIKFYTLYGHLSSGPLEGLAVGESVRKGKEIGRIGLISENAGDWAFSWGSSSSQTGNLWLRPAPKPLMRRKE